MEIRVGQIWVDPGDGEQFIVLHASDTTINVKVLNDKANRIGRIFYYQNPNAFCLNYQLSESSRIKQILENYNVR